MDLKLNRKQTNTLFLIFIGLLVLVISLMAAKQNQEVRKKAQTLPSLDATLSLIPPAGTVRRGENFSLAIMLNSGSFTDITAVDAIIYYDKSKLHANSVTPSDLFPVYVKKPEGTGIDESGSLGKIQISGVVDPSASSQYISGNNLILATVSFFTLEAANPVSITLDFQGVGARNDSNVVSYSYSEDDILSNVVNASFTILAEPSTEAMLYLLPASGTANTGENFSLNMMLNAGQFTDISAVDAVLSYDKTKLHAVSVDGAGLFPSYVKTPVSGIDESRSQGKIQISGVVDPGTTNQFISGNDRHFATVNFTAMDAAPSTTISFVFLGRGARNDSNIVSYSAAEDDVLSGVSGSSFTIIGEPVALSPTPTPTGAIANIKIRFQGVAGKKPDKMVKVTVAGGPSDIEKVFNNVPVVSDEAGLWTTSLPLEGVGPGDGYIFLIKGPVHLQRKFCDSYPTADSETEDYHCGSVGRISLTNGVNNLDFSRALVYIGDLPPQDGVMNARDGSDLRSFLGRSDAEAVARADVNFDGMVNTNDWSLLIESMQVRYDEER